MLNKPHFAVFYQRLERAFGMKENPLRMETYYQNLNEFLDEKRWERVVDRWIRTMSAFPKIAELLAQPECRANHEERQSLLGWAKDLCKARECRDGFISADIDGYSMLFACPVCDRAYRDRPGYTSIQGIARWKGKHTLFSEEEMKARYENRLEVVEKMRDRRMRPVSPEVSGIGGSA